MRFVFCGYDFFASALKALIADGHELDALLTCEVDGKYNKNSEVLQVAAVSHVPVFIGKPSLQLIQRLISTECKILIAAGYPYRLPVIDKMIEINVHPSLLPVGRGPWPLPYVILNNLSESGVTLHQLTSDMDQGPIISQQRFDLSEEDNLETLSAKSRIAAKELVLEFMRNPIELVQHAQPQSTSGSYWPFPSDTEWHIDWSMPVEQIDRICRAFGKLESTCNINGKKYVVRDLRIWKAVHPHAVGTIVESSSGEFVIAAKNGFVCLRDFELDASD